MNMNQKYMLVLFLSIFTIALCAMNQPQTPPAPAASSPESPQSPGERHMRQQHLVRRLSQQIDATIYTVLPRAQVVPPHLNAPIDQIVNDWFFTHLTAEQVSIINRIAGAIRQRTRVTLTGNDMQLYLGFPTIIGQTLRPYVSMPELETAPTEIYTTRSEEEALSTNKRRKR